MRAGFLSEFFWAFKNYSSFVPVMGIKLSITSLGAISSYSNITCPSFSFLIFQLLIFCLSLLILFPHLIYFYRTLFLHGEKTANQSSMLFTPFFLYFQIGIFPCSYYLALSIIFTTPLLASTSTKSPSFSLRVAILVPITHGMPNSRDTIAA